MSGELHVEGSSGSDGSSAEDLSNETPLERAVSPEALDRGVSLPGLVDAHDHKALVGIDHWQDIQLKKTYARWLLELVAAQLFVADVVFVVYAWAGEHWRLDAGVVQVWLVATLVELIGVALVITRYLFPRRDRALGDR
jgi:hypothetical protein